MVTVATLERLAELEERLAGLGLGEYRDAVDKALQALGGPSHRFLRTGEAARALGVSIPTVKRWGKQGILPITRVRGRWIVPAESVKRLKQAAAAVRNPDESVEELGAPLPRQQQRRMLRLGRKAERGTLNESERAEYEALIRDADRRSARAALAAVATRAPEQAATLRAATERAFRSS